MILQAIFFYLFGGITVASAVMVIAARNPVHSVLFLILAFVNAAGLFVLMGAEFLAMIGAIVLTLHHKPNVRRQTIAEQVARHKSSAIEIVKVKSGQGLQ